MPTWKEINSRIQECRNSARPVDCLTRLFEDTSDAHVAMKLGGVHEDLGEVTEAERWYQEAEQRYPLQKYKRQARAAFESLRVSRTSVAEPAPISQSTQTLYVVSCSRRKIWDDDPTVHEPFLPARVAYTGQAITSWLRQPESQTARWLILSAKYGFIEPDHPINNYDVTFNDPGTGPVTLDALRAQIEYQVRWADRIPLRSFSQIIVYGSASYESVCRRAFGATRLVRRHELPVSSLAISDVDERCRAVANALADIPEAVFEAFDRREPEWPVLERLSSWSHPYGLLAAVSFALTDYQLGAGGATAYWKEVEALLSTRKEPGSTSELSLVIDTLVTRPVSTRLAHQKCARVRRLLTSPFVEIVKARSLAVLGRDPFRLWDALAEAMKQGRDAKTIVFAMKIFDLLHCASLGEYARFGATVPIVADLRIARLSFSAGVVPLRGSSVSVAMSDAGTWLRANQPAVIDAWSSISLLAGGLNLFRVDSLAWQLARPVYEHRDDRETARSTITEILQSLGTPHRIARRLAIELTVALPAS